MNSDLLSLKDAGARLGGLSPWTLRSWAYDGRIASVKVGRLLKIPASEIDRIVIENTRPRQVRPAQHALAAK